ncbi:Serine/threonine protein kinase [Nitrosomonas aestuarii]|uniref:non-specific serine/threonine protein kinase n=1 Tax=Nitrosomonas aestuarii TaxID=52441 RepID=A0A1I4AUC7_9PROT|nr:protein kinase [Nitrosomonas aestuarii]SFK59319.1 Serine/threonine protein kinase [Nitrosomonas aestuarii]
MTHIHNQILPQDTQIGVYEIKNATKIGSFDITYRAWNHHLKEHVEIQEYFPHELAIRTDDGLGVTEKSVVEKESFKHGLKVFLNQAEALVQIEHPNAVTAENILQFNGTAYLIKPCREGVPLSKLVQSPTSFSETEIKFILTSILNALQLIHDHKIVHSGIQPETIWLSKEGEPILVDFAGARLTIAARTARVADELAIGYAPAEQYEHADTPGPATDFYALGATMYFCMTHRKPAAAQTRKMALSEGEPDPLVPISELPGAAFSAELAQTLKWMLQLQYADRPQSAAEILALLKSEQADDRVTPTASALEPQDTVSDHPATKKYIWAGTITGIVALIAVGLWLSESTSDLFDNEPVSASETANQSSALTVAQPDQEVDPVEVSGNEEQLEKLENDLITESPTAASLPTAQPELVDTITIAPQSKTSQQLTAIDKSFSQSEESDIPEAAVDKNFINKHLNAAENAIKHERLTTPSSDNAYQYYQMVLAMEPDNAQALAGLQRIVDRYIQFIESTKHRAELDTARLYLQRAESVLPNDPKLQSIREELAARD